MDNASNENWWSWKGKEEFGWKEGMPHQKNGRDKLFEMGENNIPVEQRVFGEGFYLRPNFIQFYNCKNILIEGSYFKRLTNVVYQSCALSECFCNKC